jgi:hypothetical protein
VLVLLIPLAFGLSVLFATDYCQTEDSAAGLRRAMLLASLLVTCAAVPVTELLSLLHELRYWMASLCWTLICAAGMVVPLRRWKQLQKLRLSVPRDLLARCASGIVVCVLAGLIAVMAPPNTWDSLTYHMARCGHWIDNRSVAPYATHTLRQLSSGVVAEFVITRVMLLSGSDRWVNLVHWSCFVLCIAGVSAIVAELGGSVRSQALAALFAATLPMAILQATSTQNDLVVAAFLVSAAYFGLLSCRVGFQSSVLFGLATSVGLAAGTKGTAFLLGPPLLVWVGLVAPQQFSPNAMAARSVHWRSNACLEWRRLVSELFRFRCAPGSGG